MTNSISSAEALGSLDLGAAPGGWTQVAVKRGAASVLAVDLLPIDPIHGATILQGDFTDPGMPERLTAALGGGADLVLSDMAPNTTGHASTDHIRIVALAEMALDFAVRILSPGGGFVAKVFQGGSEKQILDVLKRNFANVRHAKPPASRKESSELYVVATGFKGHPQRRLKTARHIQGHRTPDASILGPEQAATVGRIVGSACRFDCEDSNAGRGSIRH